MARARAMATRCICPPESSVGLWSMRSARPDAGHELLHAVLPLALGDAAEEHGELHVLEGGDLGQEVEVLEDEAHAAVAHVRELVPVQARHGLAREVVGPVRGGVQAADEVHEGGFARTRGPDDGHELARASRRGRCPSGPPPGPCPCRRSSGSGAMWMMAPLPPFPFFAVLPADRASSCALRPKAGSFQPSANSTYANTAFEVSGTTGRGSISCPPVSCPLSRITRTSASPRG